MFTLVKDRILVFLFAATLVVLPIRTNASFAEPDQKLRWSNGSIRIALSASMLRSSPSIKFGSDVREAFENGLSEWERVSGLKFEVVDSDLENISPAGPAGDGVSLVTIAGNAENVLFFQGENSDAPAATRVFRDRKGNISEADIVLNPTQSFSTDGTFGTYDLESVLLHELGHFLGLDHIGVGSATMYHGVSKNGLFGTSRIAPQRTLSQMDKAAVRAIYGADDGDPDCCGSLKGRLRYADGTPAAGRRIIAESPESGEMLGFAVADGSGNFQLAGMIAGEIVLKYIERDGALLNSSDLQERATIRKGAVTKVSSTLGQKSGRSREPLIGTNGILAETSVAIIPGQATRVYVGFAEKPAGVDTILSSSKMVSIDQSSILIHSDYDGVWVISFEMIADPEIGPGDYSLELSTVAGVSIYLPAVLSIEP